MLPALFPVARDKEAVVADFMQWNNKVTLWDVLFTISLNDWELGYLQSFFDLLYAKNSDQNKEDQIC